MIINGNNIDVLKKYPDNHFDAVVTDPPYGLGKEPNASELMKDWIEHGYHEVGGSGFMGKEWDAFVPQPVFWKEVFRVLKPGGHVLSFFGTRTYDWGVMSMRFAGFEVRDCIQWLYGSGFPKSHNISKALDKMEGAERQIIGKKERGSVEEAKERGVGFLSDPANRNNTKQFGYGTELITAPSTEAAKQWDGWGTALKPAHEDLVLARKPLEKGLSIAENVLKWGVGGINIDASRISTDENITNHSRGSESSISKGKYGDSREQETHQTIGQLSGRFPANIILGCNCEDEENHNEDCPIRILDEQSGISKSIRNDRGNINGRGGASRFFYVAKASKSERNKGLDGFEEKVGSTNHNSSGRDIGGKQFCAICHKRQGACVCELPEFSNENPNSRANFHPTVKPVELMRYLVKMITPPSGKVLDPFVGSGTTGIAAKMEGLDFVGIEQDADYCKIAESRIASWVKNPQINLF